MLNRLLTLCCLACVGCAGPVTEKILVANNDPHDLYANIDQDSTSLFYHKIVPKGKPKGVLVILPGSGELVADVQQQIDLDELAVKQNLLVVIPSINWGTNKHYYEHQFLDLIFKQVVEAHQVPKDKFVLGGFSGGGMLALTYTEKANRDKDSAFLQPKAVFGVDPPLDYAHLWKHCEKDIERNVSPAAVAEGKWILDMYRSEFGGPPEMNKAQYVRYSIYSHDEPNGGNAQYLLHTPVLLFTEPDVQWQMQNRQRDYYDMNCVDIAALINFLQIRGNKQAKLILTSNKGKRPDGQKHPHSWSIMDGETCLNWILQNL